MFNPAFAVFRRWTVGAGLLASCLLLALTACGRGETGQATLPEGRELLGAVAEATERLESVHFSLTHPSGTTAMGSLLTMLSAEGDVVFPSRVQATFQGTVPAFNAAVELKLVQVGAQAFLSDPLSGRWGSVEARSLPFQFTDLDRTLAQAFRAVQSPGVKAGKPVNGASTYEVAGTIATEVLTPLLPGAVVGKRAKVQLVASQQEKRPWSIRIEGPLLPDDKPDTVRLLRLSGFDRPITIELPPER